MSRQDLSWKHIFVCLWLNCKAQPLSCFPALKPLGASGSVLGLNREAGYSFHCAVREPLREGLYIPGLRTHTFRLPGMLLSPHLCRRHPDQLLFG